MLCHVGDKVERTPVEKLAKETVEKVGNVRWIGADEKFFLVAAVPFPSPRRNDRTLHRSAVCRAGSGRAS